MQTTTSMLKQERTNPHSGAVSFLVNLTHTCDTEAAQPEIKKRLEAYSSTEHLLTLESISEKLKSAERRRQMALINATSPRVAEERRRAAAERKRALDMESLKQAEEKQREITQAEEKRKTTQEQRRNKLRQHIAKVEERCREHAERRQSSAEKLKTELERKLNLASAKREEQLEQIKTTAHALAERKKSTSTLAAGAAYDEQPGPTHANIPHTTTAPQMMTKK